MDVVGVQVSQLRKFLHILIDLLTRACPALVEFIGCLIDAHYTLYKLAILGDFVQNAFLSRCNLSLQCFL